MYNECIRDENVLLMGEDVGVFGGDFGTSVGHCLKNLDQNDVRDCPISEAAALEQHALVLLAGP